MIGNSCGPPNPDKNPTGTEQRAYRAGFMEDRLNELHRGLGDTVYYFEAVHFTSITAMTPLMVANSNAASHPVTWHGITQSVAFGDFDSDGNHTPNPPGTHSHVHTSTSDGKRVRQVIWTSLWATAAGTTTMSSKARFTSTMAQGIFPCLRALALGRWRQLSPSRQWSHSQVASASWNAAFLSRPPSVPCLPASLAADVVGGACHIPPCLPRSLWHWWWEFFTAPIP